MKTLKESVIEWRILLKNYGNCWAVIADNNYETFLRNFNKIRRMK